MALNCYDQRPLNEIADHLGWSEATGDKRIDELSSACIILCKRVEILESKLAGLSEQVGELQCD